MAMNSVASYNLMLNEQNVKTSSQFDNDPSLSICIIFSFAFSTQKRHTSSRISSWKNTPQGEKPELPFVAE